MSITDKDKDTENKDNNKPPPKHDQKTGLPPQIPNNKQQLPSNIQLALSKVSKDRNNVPNIDSNFIFQSSNLNGSNVDLKPTLSVNKMPSSQIRLTNLTNDSGFTRNNGSIELFNAKQQLDKEQQFPPEIDIDTYFEDFYRREIEASQSSSKEECMSIVEPYSIEHYAATHFRKQLQVIILNKQGIKKLTTFSDKPFSLPLLAKTPLKKKAVVKKLASYILIFIGVYHDKVQDMYYKNKKEEQMNSLLLAIVYMLHNDETLVSECYMQLIKAMRENPSQASLDQCWTLFLTIASLFNVVDWEVQNVVRWFLVNRMFSDDLQSQLARFCFISFHDRQVLRRSFDQKTTRKDILEIPLGVQNGRKAFRCSLYMQMWTQRRKYPKLPIPLTLYLTVKALIKNGALMTPKPFPYLKTISLFSKFKNANLRSNPNSDQEGSDANKDKEKDNDDDSDDEEYDVSGEDDDDGVINMEDVFRASNQLFNGIATGDETSSTVADDDFFEDEEEEETKEKEKENGKSNDSYYTSESSSTKTPVKKCNMKILKKWSLEIFDNEECINDGEVSDLMGFFLTWMLNLVDPIIPKNMSKYFIETFDNKNPKQNDYSDFVENLPLLHKNTLKYIIGFLREIAKNVEMTEESHKTIALSLGTYFVSTTFATVDPFTRKKMIELAPRFLLYCLDNIDVTDVYPLNPAYLVRSEE